MPAKRLPAIGGVPFAAKAAPTMAACIPILWGYKTEQVSALRYMEFGGGSSSDTAWRATRWR